MRLDDLRLLSVMLQDFYEDYLGGDDTLTKAFDTVINTVEEQHSKQYREDSTS